MLTKAAYEIFLAQVQPGQTCHLQMKTPKGYRLEPVKVLKRFETGGYEIVTSLEGQELRTLVNAEGCQISLLMPTVLTQTRLVPLQGDFFDETVQWSETPVYEETPMNTKFEPSLTIPFVRQLAVSLLSYIAKDLWRQQAKGEAEDKLDAALASFFAEGASVFERYFPHPVWDSVNYASAIPDESTRKAIFEEINQLVWHKDGAEWEEELTDELTRPPEYWYGVMPSVTLMQYLGQVLTGECSKVDVRSLRALVVPLLRYVAYIVERDDADKEVGAMDAPIARFLDAASNVFRHHASDDFNVRDILPDVSMRRALFLAIDRLSPNGNRQEFEAMIASEEAEPEADRYALEAGFVVMVFVAQTFLPETLPCFDPQRYPALQVSV